MLTCHATHAQHVQSSHGTAISSCLVVRSICHPDPRPCYKQSLEQAELRAPIIVLNDCATAYAGNTHFPVQGIHRHSQLPGRYHKQVYL